MSDKITSLDHIVVAVSDLDAATADYATMFGLVPSWRGRHPSQGSENALFALSNTYVELIAPAGEGATGDLLRARLGADGEGPVALAFGTPSLTRCYRELAGRGIAVGGVTAGEGVDSGSGARRTWHSAWLPGEATRGVPIFVIEHESGVLPAAQPQCAESAAVDAVDHVVVMSGDLDAASGVYGETLGLRLALDREFPERGVRLLFFRVGGVTVELGGRIGAVEAASSTVDKLWGIAYRVGDVEAAQRRLRDAGVAVSDTRAGNKKGTRVFTVQSATHGVATLVIGADESDA